MGSSSRMSAGRPVRIWRDASSTTAPAIANASCVDEKRGAAPRFSSPHDAFAIAGAVVELASRQIRTGEPDDIRDLEPVVERLVAGLLHAAAATPA